MLTDCFPQQLKEDWHWAWRGEILLILALSDRSLTILRAVKTGREPMTTDATLTSKGQITIPKEIRDSLGLKPGDRMTFTQMPDGTVVMRVKSKSVMDLAGLLRKKGRKPVRSSACRADAGPRYECAGALPCATRTGAAQPAQERSKSRDTRATESPTKRRAFSPWSDGRTIAPAARIRR